MRLIRNERKFPWLGPRKCFQEQTFPTMNLKRHRTSFSVLSPAHPLALSSRDLDQTPQFHDRVLRIVDLKTQYDVVIEPDPAPLPCCPW